MLFVLVEIIIEVGERQRLGKESFVERDFLFNNGHCCCENYEDVNVGIGSIKILEESERGIDASLEIRSNFEGKSKQK